MYTSWKNAPNHGFSLYSMTPGLSATDSEDISKMMKYVLQPGMPRDPSDEEIASVLPRNVAFFPLSSGRYCLAQAGYVGREYRGFEDGGRLGNYLLHAYILDDVKDVLPMSFVGDDIFRYDLTKEEWQATNPAPLPIVELAPVGKMLTQSEIASFFDATRIETLEKLVQAIITASANGKTVFFNDENANMRFWYKALAVCLPVSLSKTAFNTYSLSMSLPVGVSPCCKLSLMNVSVSKDPAIPITAPNLADETRKGNFVIDLVRGAYSPVTVGSYAKAVCAKFKANLFDAVNFAKKIDVTAARYSCTVDQAMDILCFSEGKLDQFPSIGDVLRVIRLLGDGTPDAQMQNSITRFAERILTGAYPYGNELCEAIKNVVYPNVADDWKQKLLAYVMQTALSMNAPSKAAFAKAVDSAIPCDKLTAARYIYDNKIYDRLLGGDLYQIHYLATMTVENYTALQTVYGKLPTMMLNTVVSKYIGQNDFASLDELVALAPGLTGSAIAVVICHYAEKKTLGQISVDAFFRVLPKATLSSDALVTLMTEAIALWGRDADFCRKYEAFAATNAQADAALRAIPACVPFFDEMEVHRFRSSRPTMDGLCNYFMRIYAKNPDDTAFEAKLTEYLKPLDWKTCLRESITVYSRCFKPKKGWTPNDLRIVQVLRWNVLEKPERREFSKALLSEVNLRTMVDGFVKDTEMRGCGKDAFYAMISAFAEIIAKPALQAVKAIETQTLLAGLLVSKETAAIFNQNLAEEYLIYVTEAIKASRKEDHPLLTTALLPLTADEPSFKKAIAAILSSNEKDAQKRSLRLRAVLLLHVSTDAKPHKALKAVFEDDFLNCSKKERLNVHKATAKATQDKDLFAKSLEYVTDFNAKHKTGFFDKLKGLFGNKK
ncbi:MAG: hypothetical protein IKJ35_05520 [Clostridia bacterium]|nr:hypothetical protein [Clostridia bacterium]